jgi:hypothetical protein
MKRVLFLKIFGGYVLVLLVFSGLILAFALGTIRSHYERSQAGSLENLGRALIPEVDVFLEANDRLGLDAFSKRRLPGSAPASP